MTEIVLVSAKLADKLFKLGFELVEQGFVVDGNKCFRFKVKPGQQVLLERILNGKS